ncbi:MAG: hypothetical protein AAGG02_04505 [Cyanobacteria bacterium P01_H01_bin.15]
MNVVIGIFNDRLEAEAAYTELEKADISPESIGIIGTGYRTLSGFGLSDPRAKVLGRIRQMATWLVPFGFISGYGFNWQTGLTIIPGGPALLDHILGGCFGAIAAGMGSVVAGGGMELTNTEGPRRSLTGLLAQGKYLVAAKGSAALKRTAQTVLQNCQADRIESYYEMTESA